MSDYLLNFNAAWELDIWGKVRRSVESSQASAQASAANIEVVRLSAQATLAQSYFLLRASDEQKRLLDDIALAFQKILDRTRNRYNSGVASRNDVALAETQLKTTQAQAIDLGVQRAQLEHAIAVLMGKPPATFAIPPAPVALKVPAIPAGVPSELLERRPDVAAAERNMAAANAQIGVAIAAYYPTITLSATGGFEAATTPLWFTWPSRFWSLGAAAAQTIFQGGALVAQTDAARARTTMPPWPPIARPCSPAFRRWKTTWRPCAFWRKSRRSRRRRSRPRSDRWTLSTNQYQAGTISTLDLLLVVEPSPEQPKDRRHHPGQPDERQRPLIKALGGGWKSSDLPDVSPWWPRGHAYNRSIQSPRRT